MTHEELLALASDVWLRYPNKSKRGIRLLARGYLDLSDRLDTLQAELKARQEIPATTAILNNPFDSTESKWIVKACPHCHLLEIANPEACLGMEHDFDRPAYWRRVKGPA